MTKLFIEKYKPKSINEFIGNKEVVSVVKNFIKDKHIPHLIINGFKSTGKTSLAHILINELFYPEIRQQRVLEINASEDRGIRIIRNRIKKYVSSTIDSNKPCAKFKIIVLDEADTLSTDSQYALRRIIEDSSKSSRFILISNNINTLIPPIISRCMVLNLKPLSITEIKQKLLFIIEKEKIKITDTLIDQCVSNCDGDVRIAMSNLQKLNNGLSSTIINNDINWDFIKNDPPNVILNKLKDFLLDGYDVSFLINNLLEQYKTEDTYEIAIDTNIRLNKGCTPLIQLVNIAFFIKKEYIVK